MIRTALLVLALALGGGAFHFGLLDGAAWAKAGNSFDPNGAAATGDAGNNLDPDGAAATSDAGNNLDPNG
jgi:hypothetical protein